VTIYFWQHVEDLHYAVKYRAIYMQQHEKIFSTMTKNFIVSLVCLFVFLLAWTRSNRELSICDRVKKFISLMTKIYMVFFGVVVCFDCIEAENRIALIYRDLWMLWTT